MNARLIKRDKRKGERTCESVYWNYVREYGPLKPAELLTDRDLSAEYMLIIERLKKHHICVEIERGVPLRLAYLYLVGALESARFDILSEGSWHHLTGCGGDCTDCFQKPWCDLGSALVV